MNLLAIVASVAVNLTPALEMDGGRPQKIGTILNAEVTEQKLKATFGAKNVINATVGTVEGQTSPGTTLFPGDPKRRVQFTWKNPKKRDRVEMIRVVDDFSSRWATVPAGIRIGTSLAQLEKLNGKPFTISGFDWDYGGNIVSFNKGKLDKILKSRDGKTIIALRLNPPTGKSVSEGLLGDREILSNNKALRQLAPRVTSIQLLAH